MRKANLVPVIALLLACFGCGSNEVGESTAGYREPAIESKAEVFNDYLMGGHYVEIGWVHSLEGKLYLNVPLDLTMRTSNTFVFNEDGTYTSESTSGLAQLAKTGKWQYEDGVLKWQSSDTASILNEYPVFRMDAEHLVLGEEQDMQFFIDAIGERKMRDENRYDSITDLPEGSYHIFKRMKRL